MRPYDDDDPFDDFFRELERVMNGMFDSSRGFDDPTGFATDTHVDVHESDDGVRVVADLVGVDQDDLTLKCDGETFTISASTDARQFDEHVRLPATVDEHSATASFNNGVLEVDFDKTDDSADIRVD